MVFLVKRKSLRLVDANAISKSPKPSLDAFSKTSRKIFISNLVDKVIIGEVSTEEMTAHASTLM